MTHPWEASYPPALNWAMPPQNIPVFKLLDDATAASPERAVIDFLGRRYTYAEIRAEVDRVASGLQQQGIGKGHHVGLCLPNCPHFVIAYYAILKAGATVVNFNPLYTAEELHHQINDSGVKWMFAVNIEPIWGKVQHALHSADSTLEHIVLCPLADGMPRLTAWAFKLLQWRKLSTKTGAGVHAFKTLGKPGARPTSVAVDPAQDVAVIQYTGGTTGRPKGALLTHRNIASNTEQIRLWLGDVPEGGDRYLAVLPLFHAFAMTVQMNMCIANRSEMILLPRFDLKTMLKTIKRCRPTLLPGVPTLFKALADAPDIDRYDLSCLRFCIAGGAPLPQQIKQQFEQLTGCRLVEGYGLSEASPVVTCNPRHNDGKSGSIGLPLPGTEVTLRDPQDPTKAPKADTPGEICLRGPQVMKGYLNNPEEATPTLLADGWLRTGDVGHMDADGYFFITDRLKEIIVCSGYNVYPRLIEDVFYKHPDVDEVVVIGIPDAYRGEAPKAFIKLKADSKTTHEMLMAYAHEHLNPIERPAAIELRAELPKTLIGKLSKKELIAEEQQKQSQNHSAPTKESHQ